MQTEFLFTAVYQYSEPPSLTAGLLHGVGTGRVEGPRITGDVRFSNRARHRADDVFEPDVTGAITTDDGAVIHFETRGVSSAPNDGGTRILSLWTRCRTDDPRYRWLVDVMLYEEGTLGPDGAIRTRVHACLPTFPDRP
jgi:hypothetical protein